MKKMIVIAALIGGMLMPAQIMAQKNKKDEKPKIENRSNRKDFKGKNDRGGKKDIYFGKPGKGNKPGKGFAMNKPRKPKKRPIIIERPAPRVYYYNNYDCDVVEAAAAVVGLAALVALIAD